MPGLEGYFSEVPLAFSQQGLNVLSKILGCSERETWRVFRGRLRDMEPVSDLSLGGKRPPSLKGLFY
ncbi:MAG: hypothetical protein LBW85_06410 [Deltaproteobacteria bacterium]|jgi:hypothetical protein|nr:hypothetical protein [Deltaproteobacteria bacterium]